MKQKIAYEMKITKKMLIKPCVKVLNVYVFVRGSFSLAPQQQTFLGGHFLNDNALSENFLEAMHCLYSIPSMVMSWMAKRKMMVQIRPKVIFTLPSTISNRRKYSSQTLDIGKSYSKTVVPSAPIETNLTPFPSINSNALLTLAILWKRILPRSGFGSGSPEITSKRSINFKPFRKSSSILSIEVPAFRRCELHHAVKV